MKRTDEKYAKTVFTGPANRLNEGSWGKERPDMRFT